MSFDDVIRLSAHVTVQQMIIRDMFQERLKNGKSIGVNEFLYPLMQGYDSVAMKIDGEVGGNDQTFNMLVGRDLEKKLLNKDKLVFTTRLLVDAESGKKMSKTEGGLISLSDSPQDMFGKTMALPDEAIIQVFIDCTYLKMTEIKEMEKALKSGANPRDLKLKLAYEIVKMYHSSEDAEKAKEYFISTFSKKEIPTEIPEIKPTNYDIITVLTEAKICASKTQARQVIAQGGVKINDKKINDIATKVSTGDVIQKGSRWFVKVK